MLEGGQLGVSKGLDPVPTAGERMLLAGLHGLGSQQLTGETQGCSPAVQQYQARPACGGALLTIAGYVGLCLRSPRACRAA